ncbi:hypothetical protein [Thermomonas sp. HDW16]|uniref:hypothetical protein n=1 Tax=Thermomonas sp. HDW16 TaxID=2714945 RepID=UPI00140A3052|nr:hypothetical protein [Thermomonas sp. HDW16]QIL19602.1 hypothetical protein G7079_02010 [Thermomonas sp. HDW16]
MNPMRRLVQLALCALLILVPCADGKTPAPVPRAVWIWEQPSYAMLESPQVAEEALAFLRRERIGILYLYADGFDGRNLIAEHPQLYRDFIRRAHAQDMQVYALLGSWYLHTERYVLPKHRGDAVAMLQRVLDYNAGAPAAARFDGVNYDIEPHLLDEWEDATRVRLLGDFLDMSAALMAAKRKSGQRLPIGPAMPFWWDGIELDWKSARKSVADHVIDTTDYVALMDYRNKAEGSDSILSHARDEMTYADKVGKRVAIGLEFNPGEPKKLSFHGMDKAAFEREAGKVEAALRGRPAFAGFVFHHYLGYRRFVGEAPSQ